VLGRFFHPVRLARARVDLCHSLAVRTVLKWIGIGLAALALVVVVAALVPASTPAIEGPNAIAALEEIELGGVPQWLLVRGKDRSKPVLLYLHGGPGSAFIPFARQFSSRLEENFVVVHWDQRGAGKSCSDAVPDETLNLEQYLADTHELVLALRKRFGVEKIFLVGHSWGSVLGVLTVQRHPELFHAYVGLGQVVNMRRNEEISYRYVVDRARAEGNQEALDALEPIHPPYDSIRSLSVQREWLSYYKGDLHGGGLRARMIGDTLRAPEYTLVEKLASVPCFLNTLEHAWDDVQKTDFLRDVDRLEVPVYFFLGRHDYNTPTELVVEWASTLQAPRIELVWFESSAHMACIEEPGRFQDELVDTVLAGTLGGSPGE
jgi:pimeloyl-ACP methyl ester carboxylesterase